MLPENAVGGIVMRNALIACLSIAALHSGIAIAQAPAGVQRLQGTVSAVSDTSLTLAAADGTSTTVVLQPTRTVTVTAPVAVDQIVPGSYVATANKTQADGTGVSVEIRVYPPDSPRFDVNRAMDASGQTMMTNGKVATAVSADGGRLLTVDYGNGTRQVKVPPEVTVISNMPGSPALVKPGVKLTIVTFPASADRPGRQMITIAKADLPK
jgi:hypothetical protein